AYDFTHFEFTRAFGATDIHAARLLVASRLSPSVELSLTGGASRVETLHLVQVAVDPDVAAITGQTTGINASYKVRYVPTIQARLSKKLTRSLLAFSYERAVSPGNGVYLTSIS